MMLNVIDISKSFGGVSVLQNVGFGLKAGQIKGVIGPNGAGKTTLFNIITGMYQPDNGSVNLHTNESRLSLHCMRPHRIARAGVGRTFQKPSIVWHLTVFENALLGAMNRDWRKPVCGRKKLREWTEYCLETVTIDPQLWHTEASKVPIIIVKKIEFARAIALAPTLVLFDEVCSGLSRAETDELTALIRAYREKEGVSVLFVEHDLRAVKNVCEAVVVIDFGRVIFDGDIHGAFKDPKVIEAYIGKEHA